ncbi:MAG: hypothetical protein ACP5H8_00495 [Candidatus Micrarchaeia archaeon]
MIVGGYMGGSVALKKFEASNTVPVKEEKKITPAKDAIIKDAEKVYNELSTMVNELENKFWERKITFSEMIGEMNSGIYNRMPQILKVLSSLAREAVKYEGSKENPYYEILKKLCHIGFDAAVGTPNDIRVPRIAYEYINDGRRTKEEILGAFAAIAVEDSSRSIDEPYSSDDHFAESMIRAAMIVDINEKPSANKKELEKKLNEIRNERDNRLYHSFDRFKENNSQYSIVADFILDYLLQDKFGSKSPIERFNEGSYDEYMRKRHIECIKTLIAVVGSVP